MRKILTLLCVLALFFGAVMPAKALTTLPCEAPPTQLQAFRITHNSAELMWSAYETAYEYGLKVSTSAINPATAAADVLDTTIYFKPFVVTGLTPATTYYFYVSANCGTDGQSDWSTAGTFTTGCAPIALPYSQDFEPNSDFMTCWGLYFNANGVWATPPGNIYYPTVSPISHTGAQSARLYANYDMTGNKNRSTQSWIVTPYITDSLIGKQVTFYGYSASAIAITHVGLMTDPTDASSFLEVATVGLSTPNVWEEIIVPFNTVTDTSYHYVAFFVDGSDLASTFYYYIDDVVIDDLPLCPKASVLTANNITAASANINWMGAASAWNVKVASHLLNNPATDTADVLTTTVNANTLALNGLSPLSTYYVYVQANCQAAGNGNGIWSAPLTFTTLNVIASVPYFCDFEDPTTNALWECYNNAATNNTPNRWVIGSAVNNGGNNALYITNNDGSTNAYTPNAETYAVATRIIQFTAGTFEISFDWKAQGEQDYDLLRAYLVPDNVDLSTGANFNMNGSGNSDPNLWISLTGAGAAGQLNGSSEWQTVNYLFTTTQTVNYKLLFFWKNDGSIGNNPPAAIDNLLITPYTCAPPVNIAVMTTTSDGFTLNWTPSASGETQWEVEIRSGNTVVGTTIVNTSSYTATGLQPQTAYTARVRSVCVPNDKSHWEAVDITTRCGDISALPYVEDFQNAAYGLGLNSFPTCWTKAASVSHNTPYLPTTLYQHTEGVDNAPGTLYLTSNVDAYNIVVLPNVNVPGRTIQQMQLTFYILGPNAGNTLKVGVMTNPSDPNTFTEVALFTINGTSTTSNQNWQECIVDFSNYIGNGTYIAFSDAANTLNYIYLDDVRLDFTPTCKKIQNLTVGNVTATTADLQWNGGTANSWEVALMAAGTDETQAHQIVATSSTSLSFSNLTPKTNYAVSVRSICAPGDTSEWSSRVAFTSLRQVDSLPFITSFLNPVDNSKWELSNGTCTNRWVIGNATGDGDQSSLYVSSDNGVTNQYDFNQTSFIYASRFFHFTPGVYEITYRWVGNGESSFDFLAAYLTPDTETFEGSSSTRGQIVRRATPIGWVSLNGPQGFENLSVNWQTQTTLVTIANDTNLNLLFYWENDQSAGQNPSAAVDNVSITQLSCSPIVQHEPFDVYNVMHLSTAAGNAQSYEIVVDDSPINTNNLTNVLYHSVVTASTDTLRNLEPNTHYYACLRAVCGAGDTSIWVPTEFQTLCLQINQLPHTWNFEDNSETGSGSTPDCWNRVSGYSTYVYSGNLSYGGLGNSLYLNSGYNTNILATPYINVPDLRDVRVRFYLRGPSHGSNIIVGAISDPDDPTTFEALDTVFVDNVDTWEPKMVRMRNYTGHGKYIAFKIDYGLRQEYSVAYVDEVTIEEDRYCDTPDNVSATQITGTGAYVLWSSNNGLTYDFVLTTEEVDPNTINGTEPSVVLYELALTDSYLDLNGYLTPNQTYWAYVKSECNAPDGRPSLWSNPCIFTTACTSLPLPYAQYFTVATPDVAGSLPACWNGLTTLAGGTPAGYILDATCFSGSSVSYAGDTAHNDLQALRLFAFNSGTASSKCFAFSPEFTGNIANYMLHFMVKGASTTLRKMLFGVIGDVADPSTFRVVDTIEVGSQWYDYGIAMADVQLTANEHLAFLADADINETNVTFYIDNFVIDTVRPCAVPGNVSVRNVVGGNADINVNVMSPTDQFVQIQLTTANVAPQNFNAKIMVLDTVVAVANLPLHVSGLSGMTTYFVYARVVCDTANSVYGGYVAEPTAFTTNCASVSIPYTCNFDNAAANTRPRCWTAFTTGGHSAYPNISSSQASSAPNSFYLYNASHAGDYAYGVLPELNVASLNGLVLNFKMMRVSSLSANKLSVGVMTDPDDITTFTELNVLTPAVTNAWEEVNVDLSLYPGTGKYVAFRVGAPNAYATIYVDDIYVDVAPTCFRPSRPLFLGSTESSASFSWNAGASAETAWEYVVVLAGDDPNGATPVATTATTASVASLTPATNYDFYVRAVCGGSDGNSSWSDACTFRTMNAPEPLPFATDFSNSADNALWGFLCEGQTNKWTIGNAVGNGDIHSLYVSNDNGATNTYNTASTSFSYAYRTLKFVPDTYTIEFDWKCQTGDAGYDGMRVFLTSSTPEAGNSNGMGSSLNTDPAGWISLTPANALLDNATQWTHVNTTLTMTDTVVYNLVVMWKNDNSLGNSTGAAAIDNISVRGSYCLIDAVNVYASDMDEITIASVNASDVQSYSVYVSTTQMSSSAVLAATPDTVVTTFPLVLGNLQSQTTYYIYVVGNCSATDKTNIVSTVLTTPCAAVLVDATHTFTEDFDTYGTGLNAHPDCWVCNNNGNTTVPYIYANAHHSGDASLWLNSTGTTYAYAATPRITGTPANGLRVSFYGFTTSAAYFLEVGVMTDPNNEATFVPVRSVQLQAANVWTPVDVDLIGYTGAGENIAFRTPAGSYNEFIVDDVEILPIPSCAAPFVTTTPAGVSVDVTVTPAHAQDTAWQLIVTPRTTLTAPAAGTFLVDTVVNALNVNLGGLVPATAYTLFARTLCDATTMSEWSSANFTTPCMVINVTPQAPFVEDFDSYPNNSVPNCWTTGTPDYSQLPKVVTSAFYAASAPGSVQFSSSNAYIATPPIANDIHTLEVGFKLRRNSNYAGQFQVGVMSDPENPATFELVEDVAVTANGVMQPHTVSLANTTLTGTNRYIAFRQISNPPDFFHLDDVSITLLSQCAAPAVTVLPSVTSAQIDITQNNGHPVEIIVTTGSTPNASSAVYAATASTPTVVVNNLVGGTAYNVFVRTLCSGDNISSWTNVAFSTLLASAQLPFVCDFEQTADNGQWLFANDVDNIWVIGTNTKNGGQRSLYVSNFNGYSNNYTSVENTSLAARSIHFEPGTYTIKYDWHTMGENMSDYLRVYLAPSTTHSLNDLSSWYNHVGTPAADCIALDGGSQLRGSALWLTHTESFTVNTSGDYLLVYQWYNDNDNTFNPAAAIDNIFVGSVVNVTLTDQVCQGHSYSANGFTVPSTQIDPALSPMTFTRLDGDTLTTLMLTINPVHRTELYESICPGTVYTQNNFNVSTAGVYYQRLTGADGCDSIVILHLTLLKGYHHHEQLTLCDSDVPYLWMGQSLTTTGSYTHTIAGPGVCDSIYTLDLVVNPTYTTNLDLEITPEELPYMWHGLKLNRAGTYVYHSVSRAGCDSVLLLTLTVTTVGLDYAEDGLFTISPNPVEKGGSVRLDVSLGEAERKGMVVEVFSSNGKLISREEPKRHPMYVKMPQEAGLYMVRLTTGSGRVLYGKVIVK